MHPPTLKTDWLITVGAVKHVWRKVSEDHKFKFLETRNINHDALQNTFDAFRFHFDSNNKPCVEQTVAALKTVIINGLAYRSLYGTMRMMVSLFWTSYPHFSKPSSSSSTSQSIDKS